MNSHFANRRPIGTDLDFIRILIWNWRPYHCTSVENKPLNTEWIHKKWICINIGIVRLFQIDFKFWNACRFVQHKLTFNRSQFQPRWPAGQLLYPCMDVHEQHFLSKQCPQKLIPSYCIFVMFFKLSCFLLRVRMHVSV